MRRRLTALWLAATVFAGIQLPANAATVTGSGRTDFWEVPNQYNSREIDFFGFIKWHGNRFCYQEWTTVGRRVVRQKTFIAKPTQGRKYYTAREFSVKAPPFRVWLTRVPDGYMKTEYYPAEDVGISGMMLWRTDRARFIKLNKGILPRAYRCPKF